ncbi:uncharacterized protein LOC130417956 [Triplophysa dalaica]|uniref:uncharacterized protein LOC130417956 n=1 Tax=Triplophysa dalaica TaxID=1582913 RepID=UPI0024DFD60B|nr:uncharacterized protein LOC130417956 [Triplophysa dalaica]
MNALHFLISGQLSSDTKIGKIGPYPLYVSSFQSLLGNQELPDEIMDAIFHLFSTKTPGLMAINNHTLNNILDGKVRARSHSFVKNNILKKAEVVIGPYLEGGNHWTFFHCNIAGRTITYLNSFGERKESCQKIADNWGIFATAKGCQGTWELCTREHDIQRDLISCGIFTAVFADAFLRGDQGYINFPSVHEERERLAILLFTSLERSGICGVCHKAVAKSKGKCLTCGVSIHQKCVENNQETAICFLCKVLVQTETTSEHEGNKQAETAKCIDEEVVERDGFLVESVLKVSDFHQAKRYLVSTSELQRRCSPPECYSNNTVVSYLRKAKAKKRNIEEKLTGLGVQPKKRTKLTSLCTKLCEDECSELVSDVMFLAAKFMPQKKVVQEMCENEDIHDSISKAESCRKTLQTLLATLRRIWEIFGLATHGLGPGLIGGTFDFIDSCLKEKIKALKSSTTHMRTT